jgi:hypothetical protein
MRLFVFGIGTTNIVSRILVQEPTIFGACLFLPLVRFFLTRAAINTHNHLPLSQTSKKDIAWLAEFNQRLFTDLQIVIFKARETFAR